MIKKAKEKNAQQVVVVCGDHDSAKYKLLEEAGLAVASRWYTSALN